MNRHLFRSSMLAAVAAAALSGCQPPEGLPTADRSATSTVARADRAIDQARGDVSNQGADARGSTRELAQDVRQDVQDAAAALGDKVSDAVITTSINGELAKDASLSALKINVDTSAGNVSLYGSAPDEKARERATQIALGVKGVHKVDNQLQVGRQ